jgi:hypothetical protein
MEKGTEPGVPPTSIEDTAEKYCIHRYLTKCYTNPQPPGFADFLRGTIALYNFSRQYGYKLLIDGEHPLFKFLNRNKNIIHPTGNSVTEEFLPPISYNDIYYKLEDIFKSGISVSVMTNSFYTIKDGNFINFGDISEDCATYMKDILSPTIEIQQKIEYVFTEIYKINMNDSFNVIHLRFGDRFIHSDTHDDNLYNKYYNKINNLLENRKDEKFVLMADSSVMAKKLKAGIPNLLYWDNSKIHMGDLKNIETSNIEDTLMDFFIMSRSKEIIAGDSGFARSNSIIYNITLSTL